MTLRANPEDALIIIGSRVSEPERDAEILEVKGGAEGGPPYLVRWSDDGHVGLVFPGGDVRTRPLTHAEPATA